MNADAKNTQLQLYIQAQCKVDDLICREGFSQLVYKNFNCTPIVRSTLLACLEQILLLEQNLPKLKPRVFQQLLLKTLSLAPKPKAPVLEKNNIVCIGHTSGFSNFEGLLFNRHFDPIRESFEQSQTPTPLLTHGPLLEIGSNTPLFDAGNSLNACIRYAMAKRPFTDGLPAPLSGQINALLAETLADISPNIQNKIFQYVCRNLVDTFACKTMFAELLSEMPPRAIIGTNYYTTIGWGLVLAAQSLDIPYIELQHGVQGPGHHAFNYPTPLTTKAHPIPTRYLTWTEDDQAHVQNNGYVAQVIGPNWFQLFNIILNPKKNTAPLKQISKTVRALENNALKTLTQNPQNRHLIFIGQGTQADIKYDVLSAELTKDIALWRVERPIHNSNATQSALSEAPIIPAHYPLPLQLCYADGIVSEYSSSAIEARLLDRQTFFSNESGKYFFGFETMLTSSFEDNNAYHSAAYINTHLKPSPEKGLKCLTNAIETLPDPAEKILSLLA